MFYFTKRSKRICPLIETIVKLFWLFRARSFRHTRLRLDDIQPKPMKMEYLNAYGNR